MNVFRLAVLEIARQGIWASLTGGWCYEPNNSIFCNTVHLYIWCTLLVLPLILGIVSGSSSGFSFGWLLAYVTFIAALFLMLKLVVSYLHTVFDTVEPIIRVKTKKSSSLEQTCRSPVSSFSARATENNVIEMIDLATERSRHRPGVGGTTRALEDGGGAGNERSKHHHVRIDDSGTATTETGEAEFLSEMFPVKMSSIFEDDNTSSTSSKNSTNELLRHGSSSGGVGSGAKPFLLPADSLELLPIASSNRKPNSEGTLRRTISSTRRKYSDSNAEGLSIKKFNVQRRRSEERPFSRGRPSSETRINSTRSEDRATLRRVSTKQEDGWRKSSSGVRKAFLVSQIKTGSSDILVDELAINKANSMEKWLDNLPESSLKDIDINACSTCLPTIETKKGGESLLAFKDGHRKTPSKSASISECCSDSEPSTHAPAVEKLHSGTATMQGNNRKAAASGLHRTVGRVGGDHAAAGTSKVVGDLKGQITKFLEELIEKHPETLDAIENVRMNRLGHHIIRSQPQQQLVTSGSVVDNDSLESNVQPANIYSLNLRDSTHVAYDHEDTSQGAIHSFQDEFGNWWTYSFDDQGVGTAQALDVDYVLATSTKNQEEREERRALGSSRAIYEMFNRRRSSGNNSSSSTQKYGGNSRRSRLTVANTSLDEPSTSSAVRKIGFAKEAGETPAIITRNCTIEAEQEEEEMLPSTSQQPTTVNIVVDPKWSHQSHVRHRRNSSSTSSSSEEGGHSSRYLSNAPTSIFHPVGGVSFTPSNQSDVSAALQEAGHRRHQSDSAGSRQFISFMNIASRLYNQVQNQSSLPMNGSARSSNLQASTGGVLYPGITSNSSSNTPSALALVAAGSSTNQQGFNLLTSSRSSVGGRFDTSGSANIHNFEQLRRLANDSTFYRHHPDNDTLMTIDGAAALPVHYPTAAQTPSLSSVTQSVRMFNDLQARGAVSTGGGHTGIRAVPLPNRTKIKYYYKLKPFPNFYIGEGWKVKLDRLSVGALFDRNNFFVSGVVDVFLATLVSFLAAAIIYKKVYADFSLLVFAFVVAGSQFSLLKSVQPDAASPVHGYNWLVAYSRPAYFCLFATIILLHDYVPLFAGSTDTTKPIHEIGWYFKPGWLRLYSTPGIFLSVKEIFTTGLLFLPIAFTIGLLPQVDTLLMSIMEQIDMHFFGATASFSLLSALISLLRSLSTVSVLTGVAYFAYHFDSGTSKPSTQTIAFSAFVSLTISAAYCSSRWSSNLLGFQLLFQNFFPSKSSTNEIPSKTNKKNQSISSECSTIPTKTKPFNSFCCTKFSNKSELTNVETAIAYEASLPAPSPSLPKKVPENICTKKNSLTSSSLSSSLAKPQISPTVETLDGDVEERQTTTIGDISDFFCLDEEKSARFSTNEGGVMSSGTHFVKPHARPSVCTDPLPEILRKTLLIRLHHDVFYFFINSLLIFGVHSTSLFLSAQPYFEMVICLLCIVFGISNHYIYTQLRTHTPWKLFARPILKPHEFHQFETTVEAKLTAFERVHVWMIILEKNILFPLLLVNLMTTQAWKMPFLPIPMMALCSFRIARTGYAQPQMLCVPLTFTFLLSSFGLVTPIGNFSTSEQSVMSPPALFTLYILTMVWPKVQEFILKIHFIAVYVAPWQISWGSAFHAFAQPFSVPHSGLICAQAAISSLFSSPLNPLLGSSFFLMSYIRPVKFWEKDYNTKRVDHSNLRLISQLDRGPMLDDSNLNAIFYEHLTRSLQQSLAGDLFLGRWATSVQQGDCFILASLYLNCLVHIIEVGNGFITFQVRGLEFRGTYCHQREVEAISEDWTDGGGCCCCKLGRFPGMLSFNNAWSLRWLAWEVVAAKYIIDGYSITDNSAVNLLQVHELRRLLVTLYVKCMIFYATNSTNFDKWISNETILNVLKPIQKNSRFVDSDQMFCAANDEDYDLNLLGISKQSFVEVYGHWINYCMKRRQQNFRKTSTTNDLQSCDALAYDLNLVTSFSFALSILGRRALGTAAFNRHANAAESFLFGLHALFKGDMRITSAADEWVFTDPEILTKVISPAVRMSLKLHQDHFAAVDDFEEMHLLYARIMQYQSRIFISHEHDPAWREAIIANTPSLLALRHMYDDGQDDYKIIMLNKMHLNMRVIKLNRECVRAFWAGQQQELIFLRNRNPERGSIQNARQVLRNMINSSADQPIGYPIYVSPLITSFTDTHPQIKQISGPALSFCALWLWICRVLSRLRRHFGTSGSSNLPASHSVPASASLAPAQPIIGPATSQAGSTPAPYRKHMSAGSEGHQTVYSTYHVPFMSARNARNSLGERMVEIELKSLATSLTSGPNQTEKETTEAVRTTKKSNKKSSSNLSTSQQHSCSSSSSNRRSVCSENEHHNVDYSPYSVQQELENECKKQNEVVEYPRARVVDKDKVFKKLNVPLHSTGSFLVCWPNEEWRRNGGENAWNLDIENKIEGRVVFVWTPFHPNQTLRSHAGFICLLRVEQEINAENTSVYIPILKEGLEILDTENFHEMFCSYK